MISRPAGRIVLLERNKPIMVLVVQLHVPLRPVQGLARLLPQVPPGELVQGQEPVFGAHIDAREQGDQAEGHVEPVFVVDEVLCVHEVLPLRLGLLARSRIGVGEGEMGLLPLPVLPALLNVEDDGIKRDRMVAGPAPGRRREGEV